MFCCCRTIKQNGGEIELGPNAGLGPKPESKSNPDPEPKPKPNIKYQMKICSFDTNLDQSIYQKNKIKTIVELINNNKINIDILCLQNIADIKKLKLLINELSSNVNLHFYPSIDVLNQIVPVSPTSKSILNTVWSKSNDPDDVLLNITSIIISKHSIINGTLNKISSFLNQDNYVYNANINFNGMVVSVYNITLQKDFTGISNKKVREEEIHWFHKIISKNKEEITINNIFDNYSKNNIHVICANLNISEYKNNYINTEFINCIKKLKSLDIYRYNKYMKNIVKDNSKSIIRKDYILLIIDDCDQFDQYCSNDEQINRINSYIYDKFKLSIKTNVVIDFIDHFENYPNISVFVVEPNIVIAQPVKEIAQIVG